MRIIVVSSLGSQRSPLKTWRIFKEEAIAGEMCDDLRVVKQWMVRRW